MTALTKIADKPTSMTAFRISTPLWERLSSPMAGDVEVAEIVADERLRREAKEVSPRLTEMAAPCGEEVVKRALQPMVLLYGVGEAARLRAFWEPYYRILGALPAEALAKGIHDYQALPDSQFFPKPGPLKALCDRHAALILKAANRARRAAQAQPPTVRTVTEAERAAVKQMLAEAMPLLNGAARAALPRPAAPPSTAGRPDKGGVTPQMRGLLERRQAVRS